MSITPAPASRPAGTILGAPLFAWLLALAAALLTGFVFRDAIAELLRLWERQPEYSHGYFVPLVSLYLAWHLRDRLATTEVRGRGWGVALIATSLAVLALGHLSAFYALTQYALVLCIAGLVAVVWGLSGLRVLWAPLVFLLFMIPLPHFFYQKLSVALQLISSELGVAVIRLFGVSVFLEGNVIDLGVYRLQVAEACNGLRYLFPLMSFGFLVAYCFSAPVWQRVVIFLSAIPITVLMNSFRIGVIGVLVEHYGIEQAEGFLHDFEGWVIFMACLAVLIAEFWLLNRLRGERTTLAEMFILDLPGVGALPAAARRRSVMPALGCALAVLSIAAVVSTRFAERIEAVPERLALTEFPMQLAGWVGRRERIEEKVLEVLDRPDHVLAYYRDGRDDWVNLFVAYYESQRTGNSAHSPQACIPGGGWEIVDISTASVDEARARGAPLRVNRVVIQKGEQRQLVYYWFLQRHRLVTSEYAAKLYLVVDSISLNRTDGALVRLTTTVAPDESAQDAERRLAGFARDVSASLEAYVPA